MGATNVNKTAIKPHDNNPIFIPQGQPKTNTQHNPKQKLTTLGEPLDLIF